MQRYLIRLHCEVETFRPIDNTRDIVQGEIRQGLIALMPEIQLDQSSIKIVVEEAKDGQTQ